MGKILFKGVQKDAVETRNTNILVSAGAGSGKTTVLVARIMAMITTENFDINRLLVVTHTNAAAAHMRTKITEALILQAKANPNDSNLKRQLTLISKANITTVSSFCLGLARRFFHKINVDPGFRVADTAEIALLKGEVLDALLEERFLAHFQGNPDLDLLRLADFFDNGTSHKNFREAILKLHDFARSAPNPLKWLDDCVHTYNLIEGLENTGWYDYFIRHAKNVGDDMAAGVHKANEIAMDLGMDQKNLDILDGELEMSQSLKSLLDTSFKTLNFPKKLSEEDDAKKKAAQAIRDSYKKQVKKLKEMYGGGMEKHADDIIYIRKTVAALVELTKEFAQRFSEEKQARNMADFSDFEHFALSILRDETEALSPEALEIGDSFDEVFIDEYQDSNWMQEAILYAVAEAGAIKRFMVGDVKQCIYQFRQAEPQIFSEKERLYRQDTALGTALPLTENFRSRKEVINAVNSVFDQIMSLRVGGVEYDAHSRLQFAAQGYQGDEKVDFRAIFHVISNAISETDSNTNDEAAELLIELKNAEIEGIAAAEHIKELFDNNFQVTEDKKRRNIKYSDIAILLRSKAAAQVFVNQLKNCDIPAFSGEDDDEYFLATEVMTILSILQIIDNPRQDIALITALFSDIFRFSADDLVQMSKNRGGGDFYTAITVFVQENACPLANRVGDFLHTLNKWREMAGFMPISQLISALYQQTDYYNFVGLLQGGKLRRANLTLLFEKAVKFEQSSSYGLFRFVRYIEKLQKTNFGLKKARTEGENADVVRIMTIHKSKGLEFPVVLVCQLGKRFNLRDAGNKMVLDYQLGIGLKKMDEKARIISETFPRAVIAEKMKATQISEEMRILYVAMTRAKEKLILIGNDKKPPPDAASGRCYMDWLLAALGENPDENIWDIRKGDVAQVAQKEAGKQKRLANIFQNMDAIVPKGAKRDDLSFSYAHAHAAHAPAKMSVSEVKRLYFNEFLRDSLGLHEKERRDFSPPAFMQDISKIDAAGRGIIMHTLLEHLDINRTTAQDVADLTARLVALSLLTAEEAEIVEIPKLTAFLSSPLAQRMRKADKIHREIPFAVNMPAGLINSSFSAVDGDVLIHGVIDACFEEGGKMVIVDYKTERITGDINIIVEKYRPQMELYHRAVEKIFPKKVGEKIMYFFDIGQAVVL